MVSSFWLHMLCLYLTWRIGIKLDRKKQIGRLVVSALICAGIDTAILVMSVEAERNVFYGLFFGVAVAELVFGTWIAFGKQRIFRNSMLLLSVTVLLGGILQLVPVKNVEILCIVGTILIPFLCEGITSLFRAKQTQMSIYEARIYWNEKEKQLSAFMDTGNRLRLYGSSVPVVLVDEAYLSEWIKEAEAFMPQKLVFLPYKGVGGKGILYGVRLRCTLQTENNMKLEGEVAAVAAEHKLFHGCMYQMILQPEVLSLVCVNNAQEGEHNVI